ncbi:MAG: carboxylating nicotinate-nucleotide diphosphorylase [Candidatus Altiarchaeota archaeon]|nr:carboxylating nicotinate-nucleotide diphosphorylase [Candidatus Altiarchaeota archaeon]
MNVKKKLLDMVDEDRGVGDITTDLVPDRKIRAEIKAKEPCTLAGVSILKTLFGIFNICVIKSKQDGEDIGKNTIVFLLEGGSHDVLVVERTALNVLSRMSGIASLTREYVSRAGDVRVASTRKTSPLFNYFENEAIKIAGGDTHRFGLYDSVLIKDNHLKLFAGVREVMEIAKKNTSFVHKVEIEVSDVEQALEAVDAGADIVMLDNMGPEKIREVVSLLSEKGLFCEEGSRKRVLLEASGNITLNNLEDYLDTGVDVISVGALTHSATAKDFSLKII